MDPSSPQNSAEPDEGISGLLNEFLNRRQAGEGLTPEQFAAEHPGAAEVLLPHLAGLPLIDEAWRRSGDTAVGEAPGPGTELPAVEGYYLIKEIGRGGMGVVYEAWQVATKRTVALKVMLAGPFASPSGRRRFEREVELAARLEHPSIVGVFESGQVAGQPYYAMGYVAGAPLDRYLAEAQPDVRGTLGLFVQICEAVEYAHGHGVVHRDLKPANVLIDQEANPHVLDFGLAKATDQMDTQAALTTYASSPGQVMGSLFYLSPEQAAGRPDQIDARTDVYALGVMLFEALTGSLPLDTTGRPSQVIQRILETAPPRPSALSNRVGDELETIVLKALEKERARRYQSAKEMAEDIRRYLEGEPILAKRPSSLYVLRKKLRKHRWAAGLAAAAVVLGLVGLWAEARWRWQELAEARQTALQCQREIEAGGGAAELVGQAVALYEQCPELPEALLVWAQAQYRKEETRSYAIRFLEERLARDPSEWVCAALLAEICRATGDAERADALQTQVERAAPDTAEAWYLRSFATLALPRALHCARKAVNREPLHAPAWSRLTYLRLQTGDLDAALQGAEKLIALGQDPISWGIFTGEVLVRQGRFREAIQQYTRVITSSPEEQGAFLYRAHAHRCIKEYAQAVADYTEALGLSDGPTDTVWVFYYRATPLWILGRSEEALEDHRRVRAGLARPSYSDTRRFLILREQGERTKAEEVLADALRGDQDLWLRQIFRCLAGQLTPEELVADALARGDREHHCEACYYAGEVCLLSGDLAAAQRWFQQCVQTGVQFNPGTAVLSPMNEYELAQWRLASLPTPAPLDREPTASPTSSPKKN